MKLRILAFGLLLAASLFGQRRFSWQNSCFNNPGLPYCQGRDYAVKKTKPGKGDPAGSTATGPNGTVVGAIDWRFADPLADTLIVTNFNKVSASPLAHRLIDQLGASQGLAEGDVPKIFSALSRTNEVALSIHDDKIVFMITGVADSPLPALAAGWKAAPVAGVGMLVGHADAVDQAVQRMAKEATLSELASMADDSQADPRQANGELWVFGSGKSAGPDAVKAGVARFSMRAVMEDYIKSDTAFEFNAAPDANVLRMWPASPGGTSINGKMAYLRMSVESEELPQRFGQLAAGPLGRSLGVFLKAARSLPARDTAVNARPKPTIYGLDGGPKEVKQ